MPASSTGPGKSQQPTVERRGAAARALPPTIPAALFLGRNVLPSCQHRSQRNTAKGPLRREKGRLNRQAPNSLGSDCIRRSKAPLLPQAPVISRRGTLGRAGPPADCSTVLCQMSLSTPPQTKDLNPAGGRTDTSLGARVECDAWATSPTDRGSKGVIRQYIHGPAIIMLKSGAGNAISFQPGFRQDFLRVRRSCNQLTWPTRVGTHGHERFR